MAFTVEDFEDLVGLLADRPDWQARLRRLILDEDFQALPRLVRELIEAQRRTEASLAELAEAQKRTEERVEALAEAQRRTEERVEALAEAQRRTEERVSLLDQRMAELVQAQKRTDERMAEFAEAQRRTDERMGTFETRMGEIARSLQEVTKVVQQMRGSFLHAQYRTNLDPYFGRILRHVREVPAGSLDLDALAEDEYDEVICLDLIVSGRARKVAVPRDAALAVETSAVVDRHDVERAVRRAALLRKAGLVAVPAVAGEAYTEGAEALGASEHVVMVRDGSLRGWPEALDTWAPAPTDLA